MNINKRGVSLIVLVITIIVMIILASAVMISLSSTNIIDKATEAVDKSNLQEVQELATLIWAEAYLDEVENIDKTYITGKLEEQGIDTNKYHIETTSSGVLVNEVTTLGALVTSAADYGKTINYVSNNGVTDWKVFYKTDDYVYIITSEPLVYENRISVSGMSSSSKNITFQDGTTKTFAALNWSSMPSSTTTIQRAGLWMAEWNNGAYTTNGNAKCVSSFLNETYWTALKNTNASYAPYVVGAIGTPTAEMFVASWNEKREVKNNYETYNKKLLLVQDETNKYGYYINDITTGAATSNKTAQAISSADNLYISDSKLPVWLASPSAIEGGVQLGTGGKDPVTGNVVFDTTHLSGSISMYYVGSSGIYSCSYDSLGVGHRPVVCLKIETPAAAGISTDIVL